MRDDRYCTYCPDNSYELATQQMTAVANVGDGPEYVAYGCDVHAEEYGADAKSVMPLGGDR